jgi:hypothetical protein
LIKKIDVDPKKKKVGLYQLFIPSYTGTTGLTTSRLNQYIKEITDAIPSFSGSTPKKEWIDCLETKPEKCQGTIKRLIALEINSTSYMLRMLSESIISVDPEAKYTFEFSVLPLNVGQLTGIWENDKALIQLIFYEEYHDTNENKKVKDPRLIMGFGPSASGKTYCAKKIIELLSTQDLSFPKTFLSIDGGIQRECSVVYQLAKTIAIQKGHAGLKNLVSSQNSKSLFDSAIIKKNVKEYLIAQKALDAPDRPRKISLYVPETLGICGAVNCIGKYNSYIEITGDKTNWIALVIWQHKTEDECVFDYFHKCKGCTESGTARQMSEGKKYSSSAYPFSMYNGILESQRAPGGYFKIHNSGGQVVRVEQEKSGLFTSTIIKVPLLLNRDPVLCHTTIQDYSPLGKGLNAESRLKLTDFHWRYIKMTAEEIVQKPAADSSVLLEEEDYEEDEHEPLEEPRTRLGVRLTDRRPGALRLDPQQLKISLLQMQSAEMQSAEVAREQSKGKGERLRLSLFKKNYRPNPLATPGHTRRPGGKQYIKRKTQKKRK